MKPGKIAKDNYPVMKPHAKVGKGIQLLYELCYALRKLPGEPDSQGIVSIPFSRNDLSKELRNIPAKEKLRIAQKYFKKDLFNIDDLGKFFSDQLKDGVTIYVATQDSPFEQPAIGITLQENLKNQRLTNTAILTINMQTQKISYTENPAITSHGKQLDSGSEIDANTTPNLKASYTGKISPGKWNKKNHTWEIKPTVTFTAAAWKGGTYNKLLTAMGLHAVPAAKTKRDVQLHSSPFKKPTEKEPADRERENKSKIRPDSTSTR